MRISATILSTVALGAMLVLGSATASMARDGGGHGGHAGMSASAGSGRAGVSASDRASQARGVDIGQNDGMRDGSDKGDDPWQSSPYYHGFHGSFLSGLFRRQ